jgi:ABC-type transport system substrate-binding protein
MFHDKKWLLVLGILIVTAAAITSCAQEPETLTVIQTVIVEGTPQFIEVEVTPVPEYPEGPIAADGLVDCLPLPEMAYSGGGSKLARVILASGPSTVEVAPSAPVLSESRAEGDVIYKVGVFEDVTTVNYWAANGPDNTVWNSYMLPPRLTAYALADKRFDFVPQVAADTEPGALTQEGDFWVAEINIRDDVKWSDGEAFTVADWIFTAETVEKYGLISGNWSNWYDFNYIDHMEAVSDYSVKIVFHTKPGLARYQYGILQSPILAEHFWAPLLVEAGAGIDALAADAGDEDVLAAQAAAQDIMFAIVPDGEPMAGSFDFGSWEEGAFLQNPSRDDYFDKGTVVSYYANGAYASAPGFEIGDPTGDVELTFEVGPFVDTVVYFYYGSQDAAILALQNGEVDLLINPLGLQRGLAERIEGDPNLTVVKNNVNGFRYLAFNHRRRPMNDCSFRQAVAVLIDKEFVTQTILQGVAFPLYSFVPEANGAWYFDDVPKLGQGLTREERTNMALAILVQAGYTWEGDLKPAWNPDGRHVDPGGRLIMPDGTFVPSLSLVAPSAGYDPLRSTFAVWIESWLNEFGIPTTAQLAGFNVIVPIIFTEQSFDMYELGWSLGLFPDYLYDFFAEEQAVEDGNNAAGYVNQAFEDLARDLLECDTIATCKVIADKIQLMLATEVPYVLLFDTGIIEAYQSAAVELPYTDVLSGLQYMHQGGGPIQQSVHMK